uniref:Kinesin motor domain-containing protein n=1 Tax=Pinguiococcus pyrenoidosus TaxID=172671 RepID=A0A7R9Y9N5_9STRA
MQNAGQKRRNSAPLQQPLPVVSPPEKTSRSATSSPVPASKESGELSGAGGGAQNVRVCVRFRPENALEREQGAPSCVHLGEDQISVRILDNRINGFEEVSGEFSYDRVFEASASQESVFEEAALPLVSDLLEGYNCTIFAYGQTGSGKTHTMMGASGDQAGVIPRIVHAVFDHISEAPATAEFTVRASFVELYLERIQDLLSPDAGVEGGSRGSGLKIREHGSKGVFIEGVTEEYASSPQDLLELMHEGSQNRAVAATRMNADSSRSHSIFILTVEHFEENVSKTGRMYLVDLAGSELLSKTQASGQTLKEAQMINRSLSALGNVIKALCDGKAHVPYRDSKLTRVLQDSLGGNAKTVLITTASPSTYNYAETLSTLRFASRAKRIKNKPRQNQERSVEEYKRLLDLASKDREELLSRIADLEKENELLRGTKYAQMLDLSDEQDELEGDPLGRAPAPAEKGRDLTEKLFEALAAEGDSKTVEVEDARDPGDVYSPAQDTEDAALAKARALSRESERLKEEVSKYQNLAEESAIECVVTRERLGDAQAEIKELQKKIEAADVDRKLAEEESSSSLLKLQEAEYQSKERAVIFMQLKEEYERVRDIADAIGGGGNATGTAETIRVTSASSATVEALERAYEGLPEAKASKDGATSENEEGTPSSASDAHARASPIAQTGASEMGADSERKGMDRERLLEADLMGLTQKYLVLRQQLEEERATVSQLLGTLDDDPGLDAPRESGLGLATPSAEKTRLSASSASSLGLGGDQASSMERRSSFWARTSQLSNSMAATRMPRFNTTALERLAQGLSLKARGESEELEVQTPTDSGGESRARRLAMECINLRQALDRSRTEMGSALRRADAGDKNIRLLEAKLENRDSHIEFLETALHEVQDKYRDFVVEAETKETAFRVQLEKQQTRLLRFTQLTAAAKSLGTDSMPSADLSAANTRGSRMSGRVVIRGRKRHKQRVSNDNKEMARKSMEALRASLAESDPRIERLGLGKSIRRMTIDGYGRATSASDPPPFERVDSRMSAPGDMTARLSDLTDAELEDRRALAFRKSASVGLEDCVPPPPESPASVYSDAKVFELEDEMSAEEAEL